MKEKRKIGFANIIIIITIVIILSTAYPIYTVYRDRFNNEELIFNLNTEIDRLKSEISYLNNNAGNLENTSSTDFYGIFTSADGIYKFVFLPNGEMCYINNNSIDYKVMPGTYYINNNTLYYSTSQMIDWFADRNQTSFFEIVDRNTLKYNNINYTRTVNNVLDGTYSTFDESITFDTNGNFEVTSSEDGSFRGTYTLNNDVLNLNNEITPTTYLLLDDNTIVAKYKIDDKLYFRAYIK